MIRDIEKRIDHFFATEKNKALLITGARQVGKTYTIRHFTKEHFTNVIEINFIEQENAVKIFESPKNVKDILLKISTVSKVPLIPHETIIFFDEVQECKEIVTAMKFLVEEGSYKYILSGSLLGVELNDVRSIPVGYMDIMEMYPLTFFEFCNANKISKEVMESLSLSFINKTPVDDFIHEKMIDLFYLYLIIGGMPEVIKQYLDTNNLQKVIETQSAIIRLYKKDIAKYDPNEKLYLNDIFDLIPSELNSKNKRFILKSLNENFKFSRYEHSFIWLRDAGVALPTFCVQELKLPLLLSKSTNLFKLFLSDVGLLASMYMNNIQMKILSKEVNINFGSIFENAIAQELKAHGFNLYFYNSKKNGEIDFIIEKDGDILPIEVKSGKNYARHNALSNIMNDKKFTIKNAIVFCTENITTKDKVIYYPVYLAGFLQNTQIPDVKYSIDLTGLQ